MARSGTKLILWAGKKHSGKTTCAAELAGVAKDQGFEVAGLLARALYHNSSLTGFDAVDLRTHKRGPLARYKGNGGESGHFDFVAEGLKLGRTALSPAATESADLVIVDEFGPVEMSHRGWRRDADRLIRSSEALILLVVRQELVQQVQCLYADIPSLWLAAGQSKSIDEVISILKGRRQQRV
jgi:nucleoside-triphosphatase THEP1